MTLDDLIEEIERSEEEAYKTVCNTKDERSRTFHNGKTRAFRICLEKLREYRLSSGAEYK